MHPYVLCSDNTDCVTQYFLLSAGYLQRGSARSSTSWAYWPPIRSPSWRTVAASHQVSFGAALGGAGSGEILKIYWCITQTSPVVLSTLPSIFHFPPHVFSIKARHAWTYGDFRKTLKQLKGANLAAQKQTPEAKFSSFVAAPKKKVSSSSPFLSGASRSSNHPEWFTGSGWQQSTRPFYNIKRCQPSPELDPERRSGEQKTCVWHVHLLRLLFTKIESFTRVKVGKRERRGRFRDIKRTSK